MTNTDYLYTAMRDFRNIQIQNRETYLKKKQNLDRYKGSAGYGDDLAKIRKERKDADAAASAACLEKVNTALKCMTEVNSKRGATAPTEEHLRLLTAASMMKKPDKLMLDSIANSLDGNAVALALLDDIAKAAWHDPEKVKTDPAYRLESYTHNYRAMATKEISVPDAHAAIKELADRCGKIMRGTGANHVREMAAERNKRMYGMEYDPDDLPQEAPYETERDFYNRELSVSYDLFAAAVNG